MRAGTPLQKQTRSVDPQGNAEYANTKEASKQALDPITYSPTAGHRRVRLHTSMDTYLKRLVAVVDSRSRIGI